jgi:hypothetical protein
MKGINLTIYGVPYRENYKRTFLYLLNKGVVFAVLGLLALNTALRRDFTLKTMDLSVVTQSFYTMTYAYQVQSPNSNGKVFSEGVQLWLRGIFQHWENDSHSPRIYETQHHLKNSSGPLKSINFSLIRISRP